MKPTADTHFDVDNCLWGVIVVSMQSCHRIFLGFSSSLDLR